MLQSTTSPHKRLERETRSICALKQLRLKAIFYIIFGSLALLYSTKDLRQLSRNTYKKVVKQKEFRPWIHEIRGGRVSLGMACGGSGRDPVLSEKHAEAKEGKPGSEQRSREGHFLVSHHRRAHVLLSTLNDLCPLATLLPGSGCQEGGIHCRVLSDAAVPQQVHRAPHDPHRGE